MEILLVLLISKSLIVLSQCASLPPPLLLVSFDGFRWDYLEKTDTPNFDEIIATGVRAQYMKNVFATKTFPNHYTLATGLYEESHGIVANHFWDPIRREFFAKSKQHDGYWWSGQPIWATNQHGGEERRSACFFWIGCEANITGQRPLWFKSPYDDTIPMTYRIDTIVQKLTDPMTPYNLALLYFHEPDRTGHGFGPDSPEMIEQIRIVDSYVGYLIQKLKDVNLWDKMNLIITSDHGMAAVSKDREVTLAKYVNVSSEYYLFVDNSPVVHVWPKNRSLAANITAALSDVPHLSLYTKPNIPPEYHYTYNPRIPPVLLVADDGWQIMEHIVEKSKSGDHGYNNSLPDMHPIFIARGPGFTPGVTFHHLDNVDVYPLMCHLLNVTAAPNNGSLVHLEHVLTQPPPHVTPSPPREMSTLVLAVLVVCAAMVTSLCVAAVVRLQRALINVGVEVAGPDVMKQYSKLTDKADLQEQKELLLESSPAD